MYLPMPDARDIGTRSSNGSSSPPSLHGYQYGGPSIRHKYLRSATDHSKTNRKHGERVANPIISTCAGHSVDGNVYRPDKHQHTQQMRNRFRIKNSPIAISWHILKKSDRWQIYSQRLLLMHMPSHIKQSGRWEHNPLSCEHWSFPQDISGIWEQTVLKKILDRILQIRSKLPALQNWAHFDDI